MHSGTIKLRHQSTNNLRCSSGILSVVKMLSENIFTHDCNRLAPWYLSHLEDKVKLVTKLIIFLLSSVNNSNVYNEESLVFMVKQTTENSLILWIIKNKRVACINMINCVFTQFHFLNLLITLTWTYYYSKIFFTNWKFDRRQTAADRLIRIILFF